MSGPLSSGREPGGPPSRTRPPQFEMRRGLRRSALGARRSALGARRGSRPPGGDFGTSSPRPNSTRRFHGGGRKRIDDAPKGKPNGRVPSVRRTPALEPARNAGPFGGHRTDLQVRPPGFSVAAFRTMLVIRAREIQGRSSPGRRDLAYEGWRRSSAGNVNDRTVDFISSVSSYRSMTISSIPLSASLSCRLRSRSATSAAA